MSTKAAFSGATITVSALSIIGGAVAMDCPTNSVIGPFARLVDPFSPLLFAIGLLFALFALLLGARRLGPLLALVAIGCGGWLYSEYRTISQPLHPEAATDVRILWFNVLASNSESADRIVDAALAEQPDILVFTEAGALTSTLDRLRATYDFVSPCEKGCTMLVATNLKVVRTWAMRIAPGFPKRYMVLEYATHSGKRGFLVANHLAKPWMSGIAETEIARLKSQYDWLTGPVAVVGDYNMPPWSLPMRQVLGSTGMRVIRGQPASWPVAAGRYGLPIDQLLVRGGVQVSDIRTFGAGLGSNHLGFVADVALP